MLRPRPQRLEALPLAVSGQEQTIGPGSSKAPLATRPGPCRSVTLRAGLESLVQGLDFPQLATLGHDGPVGGSAPGPLPRGAQGRLEGSALPPARGEAAVGLRRGGS